MADTVVDIIHRLNYQVNDAGLQDVTRELTTQTERIAQLTARQQRLRDIQAQAGTQDVARRERINRLIAQTQGALEREGRAVESTLLTNRSLNQEMNRQIGLVGNLERQLELLRNRRDRAFDIDSIRRYNQEIQRTQTQLNATRNAGLTNQQANGTGIGGIAIGSAIGAGVAGLVGRAAAAIKDFAGDIVSVTNKYEKLNALLSNTLGGKQAGADAFKLLTDFAAETPFQLDELTASYLKLINRGIKPTKEELTAFGDIAAAQGKSFDQFTEAILDATTGEFERLKEFGIKASQSGNQVTLAFGNISKTVPKSAEAIKAALLAIRNEAPGIAGAMKVISNTTKGALSNLADGFDRLKNNIGSGFSGAIKSSIGFVSDLVASFNSFLEIPVEQKILAEKIEFDGLIISLSNVNLSTAERASLITELNQKYPELIRNLNLETASQAQLNELYESGNKYFATRIKLAGLKTAAESADKEAVDAQAEIAKRQRIAGEALATLGVDFTKATQLINDPKALTAFFENFDRSAARSAGKTKDLGKALGQLEDVVKGNLLNFGLGNSGKDLNELVTKAGGLTESAASAQKLLNDQTSKSKETRAAERKELEAQIELLQKRVDIERKLNDESTSYLQLNKQLGELQFRLAPYLADDEKPQAKAAAAAAKAKKKKEETAEQIAARLLKEQQLKDQSDFDKKLLQLQKNYRLQQENIKNLFPGDDSIEPLAELQKKNANDVLQLQVSNQDQRLATLKKFNKATEDEVVKINETKYNLSIKAADEINKLESEAAARDKARREKIAREKEEARLKTLKDIDDDAEAAKGLNERQKNKTISDLNRALSDGDFTKAEKKPFTDLLNLDPKATADEIRQAIEKAFAAKDLQLEINRVQLRINSGLLSKEDKEKTLNELAKLQKDFTALFVPDKKEGKGNNPDASGFTSYYEAISNAAAAAAVAVIDAEEEMLAAQIGLQEKRVEAAKEIADRGNAELLQREQERLDELNRKKEAAARTELAINQALTLSNAILAVAKAAGQSGGGAVVIIPAVIAALVAGYSFVRTLANDAPAFAGGVVDYRGRGTTKSDSNVVRISNRESVMTAEATERYKPILEEMNALRFKPTFLMPNPRAAENILAAKTSRDLDYRKDFKTLADRMENVERAILSRPANKFSMDGNGVAAMVEEIQVWNTKKKNL